ncbi:MAG: hypothetical protein ACK5P5_04745 [Pseudobdellovibrionaceae bacterium]
MKSQQRVIFENTKQNKFIQAYLEMKQEYLTGCLPENAQVETVVRKQGRHFCIKMIIHAPSEEIEFSSAHRSPFLAAEYATDHLRDEILKRHSNSLYP